MNISPEMYDAINYMFLEIYFKAKRYGMTTDNIELHATPRLLNSMEIKDGELIDVGFSGFEYQLKVVVDKRIPEFKQGDGTYKSDIEIYAPDWK